MKVLFEEEAEEFLEKEGFPVPFRGSAYNLRDVISLCDKIKFPIAMKVKGILHKSDVGGVKLDIRSKEEAIEAFTHLNKIRGSKGVLLQEFMEGLQLIAGIKDDPTFGKVLVFGSGGIYTEILSDVSFRVCPISKTEALNMIKETKISKILLGARRQHFPLVHLVDFLVKLSELAVRHPTLSELDVNPLIINQYKIRAVDCRAVFS